MLTFRRSLFGSMLFFLVFILSCSSSPEKKIINYLNRNVKIDDIIIVVPGGLDINTLISYVPDKKKDIYWLGAGPTLQDKFLDGVIGRKSQIWYISAIDLAPLEGFQFINLPQFYIFHRKKKPVERAEILNDYVLIGTEALKKNPNRGFENYFFLGEIMFARGNYSQAVEYYVNAIKLKQDDWAGIKLAQSYKNLNKKSEAKATLQNILQRNPKHIFALNWLAELAINDKDWNEAERLLKTSLQQDPKQHHANFLFGNMYEKREQWDRSVEYYKKAIESAPNNAWYRVRLGWVYMNQKQPAKSRPEFEMATQIEPQSYDYWNNLGTCYVELGEIAKAIECFKKSLELKPDQPPISKKLEQLQQKTGSTQ